MKYSILINQAGVVSAGLGSETDLKDWAIIDYISGWQLSPKAVQISNGHIWINYKKLIENMPLLGLKKAAISGRIKKLNELDLLSIKYDDDNRLYAKITSKCWNINNFSGSEQGVQQNEHPVRQNEHPVRQNEHPVRQNEHPVRQNEHPVQQNEHTYNYYDSTINSTIRSNKEGAQSRTASTAKSGTAKKTSAAQSWRKMDFSNWPSLPEPEQLEALMAIRARKRAAVTQRVVKTMGNELKLAVAAGFSIQTCFDEWEYRNWQAFRAKWMIDGAKRNGSLPVPASSSGAKVRGEGLSELENDAWFKDLNPFCPPEKYRGMEAKGLLGGNVVG